MIQFMNHLIADYQKQGYVLTVRQLYYQLVAQAVVENTLQSYKRVAGLINDAKLAGLIDWDAIEDRTREFLVNPHWSSGGEIIRTAANSYGEDMWDNQESRVFVIIEKEALVGVLQRACRKFDVPMLAARGYPSGTVLRDFAESHLLPAIKNGQFVRVLHLGDHDPSGIDMTRDLVDRISMFTYGMVTDSDIDRIALTMDQVDEVKPPENPAKSTDSRFASYRREYGTSSWELDALTPQYLNNLVEMHIESHIDPDSWQVKEQRVLTIKQQISARADEQERYEASLES
nr:hypothetical protein [Stutzerimonas stutzeri]